MFSGGLNTVEKMNRCELSLEILEFLNIYSLRPAIFLTTAANTKDKTEVPHERLLLVHLRGMKIPATGRSDGHARA